MSNEKKVLLDLGNVLIKEFDRLNVEIFRLETYHNTKTNETKTGFRSLGYSRNIITALKRIYKNSLLVDESQVNQLSDVINQIKKSDEIIKNSIKELEESLNVASLEDN